MALPGTGRLNSACQALGDQGPTSPHTTMHTFETGGIYAYTHIGNADLHHAYRVVRRTEKSVWLEDKDGSVKRRGVTASCFGDEEVCSPEGSFSMSPILGASSRLADDHQLGPWSTGMGP